MPVQEHKPASVPVQPTRAAAECWQETVMFFATDLFSFLHKQATESPTQFMIGCILVLLFWMNWRLGSMQNRLYEQSLMIGDLQAKLIEAYIQANPSNL